ncbi:MAG: glycosyltransferase family 39 protein [Gallionellaceae bacterium]|nr:glycosyltransferase family 39 protein [Gallionellaceae bacterium]
MQQLTAKNFWAIYAAGALFMLLALNLYYIGEEPIFPIESQEMWEQGVWFKKLLYGCDVLQPPLLNWLIAPLASLIGWPHVKEAARILTIMATAGSGLMLGWLAFRLSRDRLFAALAAASYLTFQDVLLYHGWLAYVDPTFAFFIFSAIALLWIAAHEHNRGLFGLSLLAISCAFLAKALTAYIFFASAIFVLLFQRDARRFLLNPAHIVALSATFAFPLFWYASVPSGAASSSGMLSEIQRKLTGASSGEIHLGGYLAKRLSYLLTTLSELFPAAWLAIYLLLRRTIALKGLPDFIRTGGWIALLCYLPYLLSPESGIRYLMPIYPLFALFAAGVIWQAGAAWVTRARRWMIAMLALQLLVFLVAFPLYQKHYRGENYMLAAQEIARITQGYPLYSNDTTAPGEIVTANLNALRYPLPALRTSPGATVYERPERTSPGDWDNGFVITRSTVFPDTKIVKRFPLAADELYLLCRGVACDKP